MEDMRNLDIRLSDLDAKAVEDHRSPRRFAPPKAPRKSARSWSAPVLWRFDRALAMDDARNLDLRLTPLEPKAVEDYRSPKRLAPAKHARNSAMFCTVTTSWND